MIAISVIFRTHLLRSSKLNERNQASTLWGIFPNVLEAA